MKISEIEKKQVVLLENGEVLGHIFDAYFQLEDFGIISFLVKCQQPKWKSLCPWLFQPKIIEIGVDEIEQVGRDLIFVRK